MNGTTRTSKKSRVLVTITPYTEQEKRVLNGTTATATTTSNGTTNSTTNSTIPVPPPPAPPLPLPTKTNEDSVEMQSIESFKLKDTPNPVIPKPPPTYFPLSNSSSTSTINGSPRHVATGTKTLTKDKEQSTSPSNETTKTTTTGNGVSPNGTIAGGPTPKAPAGKVAIRIGAYEGEAKQPAKLDFLAQQSRIEKSGSDESNGPVVSRLQNELAATLQRSNLRRKTEGDNQANAKSIPENITTSEKETTNPEPNKLPQSTVEKLASALGNKVTIRVNPEDGSR